MDEAQQTTLRLSVLKTALAEASTVVRAYDTKAQIAAVGYIFSLGIAGQIQTYVERDITMTGLSIAVVWAIFMVPILQFGLVLYPTRATIRGQKGSRSGVLFVEDNPDFSEAELAEAVRRCDPFAELSSELLRISQLRHTKRKRFIRGLVLTMIAYAVLFTSQVLGA
jgi:hypothetical protein